MSLDFNVSKVHDHTNITTAPFKWMGKSQWHPVTNSIVWATIPCGFNKITEDNFDMVWQRLSRWQQVIGAFCEGEQGDVYITEEDVRMHIGLSTNASVKTDQKFAETLLSRIDKEVVGNCSGPGAMDVIGWLDRPGRDKEPKNG